MGRSATETVRLDAGGRGDRPQSAAAAIVLSQRKATLDAATLAGAAHGRTRRPIAVMYEGRARDCLAQAQGAVKPAVPRVAGTGSVDRASKLLTNSGGQLCRALAQI